MAKWRQSWKDESNCIIQARDDSTEKKKQDQKLENINELEWIVAEKQSFQSEMPYWKAFIKEIQHHTDKIYSYQHSWHYDACSNHLQTKYSCNYIWNQKYY